VERLLLLHLYQEQEEGELVQILGPWWGIVAALVLGTGAGDNSAPSSSVSAIVPHLALLPSPAKSSSILVLLCPTSTPMLELEILLCTLVLPPPTCSFLILWLCSDWCYFLPASSTTPFPVSCL